MPAFERCLIFFQGGFPTDAVVHEISGVKLLCEFETAITEDFFEHAPRDCLILLLQGRKERTCKQ